MRISVIIPVYNPGDDLEVQLEALGRQDVVEEFEVVLADNNSTDGTLETLDPQLVNSLNARIVDARDGTGPSYARNVGSRSATGELLLFCDQDDMVHPTWIRKMVSFLDEGQFDVVSSAIEGDTLNVPGARKVAPIAAPDQFQPPNVFAPVVVGCSMAATADAYRSLGGMREDYPANHDVEFGWRAHRSGLRVGYLPEALVAYRYRSGIRAGYSQGLIRGIDLARLDADHPDNGLPPQKLRSLVATLARLPFSWKLAGEEWGLIAGITVGRIRGGIRFKTLRW